jgi:hypothetical protein
MEGCFMVRAFRFAADRTTPTATTWWFAPLGGFLAAGLLLFAGMPVTFSEFIHNALLRSGFEVLVCVVVAYLVIFVFWLAVYPIHLKFASQGGIRAALRQRLGAQMGPFVFMGIGLFSFAVFTSVGLAWLTFQVMNGTAPLRGLSAETPNTVGNPDFALQAPEGRYRFKWDPMKQTRLELRLDTEKNPDFSNNPIFILRNKTNTVAYNVSVIWKSEIAASVAELTSSAKLSKFSFVVTETKLLINPPAGSTSNGFQYYLSDSPQQNVSVIAKEAEVYLPPDLWAVAALYLINKMPPKIGETSDPFIARVTLNWETAEGKKRRDYRTRITATNSKTTDGDMPVAEAFLNFSLEEIPN